MLYKYSATEKKKVERNIKKMCSVAKVYVHSCRVARKTYHEAVGLHYVMFIPALSGQGTPEQCDKWLALADSLKVVGTYAQTELGHGQSFSLMGYVHSDPQGDTSLLSEPGLISSKLIS